MQGAVPTGARCSVASIKCILQNEGNGAGAHRGVQGHRDLGGLTARGDIKGAVPIHHHRSAASRYAQGTACKQVAAAHLYYPLDLSFFQFYSRHCQLPNRATLVEKGTSFSHSLAK